MTWFRVSGAEIDRLRKLAADRKAKREEKRKAMPWGRGKEVPPAPPAPAKPRKRRKKSPIEVAWDRNDALWSMAVRLRDTRLYGKRCRICGQTPESNGASLVGYHLVPKKRGASVRWLLENGVQGCSRCNYGERMNVSKYREKHVALVGVAMMEALEARAHTRADFGLEELLAIGTWLKAVIEAAPDGPIPGPPRCLPPISTGAPPRLPEPEGA
jgi:hypothetical protein